MAYPDRWQVRKVRPNGEIRWHGESVFIGEVLAGELIGLRRTTRACDTCTSPGLTSERSIMVAISNVPANGRRRVAPALRNGSAPRA